MNEEILLVADSVSNWFSVAQYMDPIATVTTAAAVLMTPNTVKDVMSIILVFTCLGVFGE